MLLLLCLVGFLALFDPFSFRLRRAPVFNVNSCSTPKQISFTLDGVLTENNARYHLNYLNSINATVTFHITFDLNSETLKPLVNEMVMNKHSVGINFIKDPKQMSLGEVEENLKNQSAWIYSAAKVYPKFVRFPMKTNSDIDQLVTDLGFIQTTANPDVASYDCMSNQTAFSYLAFFQEHNKTVSSSFIPRHSFDCPFGLIYHEGMINMAPAFNYSIVSLDTCVGNQGSFNLNPPTKGYKKQQSPATDSQKDSQKTTTKSNSNQISGITQLAILFAFALLI